MVLLASRAVDGEVEPAVGARQPADGARTLLDALDREMRETLCARTARKCPAGRKAEARSRTGVSRGRLDPEPLPDG
ncbi:hypothetical protein, partial [Streptomyces microflavus]|uniref:hypothetical protein n=1 Tax=Streptomyces microflavus TaxID=1919 RepID=UPI0019429B87